MRAPRVPEHWDVIVVGSGFGGSVAALRLSEKGYRVLVLEAGARFADEDFALTSFHLRRYLFRPEIGCYGIQRIDTLNNAMILSGAGVGGGSLVYANTLYEPLDEFYADPQWAHIADWRAELAPYYDQAKRMLGVVTNPTHTPADEVMRQTAEEMGVGETFRPAPVGVHFGDGPGVEIEDPYFGGAGPTRAGCIECGECMTGCRHNAKNTLVKNYLHLAEGLGAEVRALSTVTRIRPRTAVRNLPQNAREACETSLKNGYVVTVRDTRPTRLGGHELTADHVVLAASALGTQRLLHRLRESGDLPDLSPRLGHLSRTNSESLLGAIRTGEGPDFSQGVAITSSIHPDPQTHIEPVRYGHGSNAMSALQTVLTDEVAGTPRWRTWAGEMWRQRRVLPRLYDRKHWSERTVIALVMQSLDNSITTYQRRSRLTGRRVLGSRQGHGAPNPTWIPVANEAVRRMARIVRGTPGGNIGEQFNRPLTAHFLGGAVIGDSPETGVVDACHRVFNYPGLHIVDGSTISANLGVNPSLTITAQAERAMALWPNKGEPDPRPELGQPYAVTRPVAPLTPAVPGPAPGALRLPISPAKR
ncbi:GMC family oxidoreductase [Ornithinimicrobium faecis]|uniref:Cholesterol oxidase n=1 Tax=Ornithinimicrobium faecis TaxID=2934158 RepID=A0ABY4YUS5_9MICO|nr:GMC family oxidoreductase [Ornithinimicrobium sp. HY1793]USQ80521.1 GMC family oxidoreductase [Ornithinimicrobium sp. HY1793]